MSDVVAGRIRDARKALRLSPANLAAMCAEAGHPEITENVIENIESGRRDKSGRRRRDISVDELRVISDVLRFSPADVLNGLPPGTLGPMSVDDMRNVITGLEAAHSFLTWQAEQVAIQQAAQQPPVIAAIVTSRRGVLIGRRNDRIPPWTFIAGEQEPGEDPADTIIREVKEETGLEIRAGEMIGERDHPATGRHMVYLAAEPAHGTEFIVGDEVELAEVKWASLAEALTLLPGMFEPVHEHLEREIGGAL